MNEQGWEEIPYPSHSQLSLPYFKFRPGDVVVCGTEGKIWIILDTTRPHNAARLCLGSYKLEPGNRSVFLFGDIVFGEPI